MDETKKTNLIEKFYTDWRNQIEQLERLLYNDLIGLPLRLQRGTNVSLGRFLLCVGLVALSNLAIAQSTDAIKYAPRPILLLSGENNVEAVMPIVLTVDGMQRLEFVPASRIKEYLDHGGQPIHLGDVLAALGEATDNINKLQQDNARLQTENEKLWKVAMKDSPAQRPPTVVVQQSAPPTPSPFAKYLLLRSLVQPTQPYRLPPPVNPNANRLQTDCTARTLGDTTSTDCH